MQFKWLIGPLIGLTCGLCITTVHGELEIAAATVLAPRRVSTYRYPVVGAAFGVGSLPCWPASNPGCPADAPAWVWWQDGQDPGFVQFAAIGPGLVAQASFTQAILWLARWPYGMHLLRDAEAIGVWIVADNTASKTGLLASYQPLQHTIRVDPQYLAVSTFMLATVLAHELTHASQLHHHRYQGLTYRHCIAREIEAFQVELAYARFVAGTDLGGLPSVDAVAATLSVQDTTLFAFIADALHAADVAAYVERLYHQRCVHTSLPFL